jgi:hypothetical protein
MGHPGLLVQDYVAGIPIWYIPNTREEDDATPSDLIRMGTYRFGQARPGQADGSGPAWLGSAASAHFLFLAILFNHFANPC